MVCFEPDPGRPFRLKKLETWARRMANKETFNKVYTEIVGGDNVNREKKEKRKKQGLALG